MAHPLEQKIGQVRRRARWLLGLYALGWTFGIVLAAVLVLTLADYLIRFQDPGVRVMASLSMVAVLGWAVYHFVVVGFADSKLGDVQIARRIEHRFPSLTDRLASTVQFLRQPELDPAAGSVALRRAVILQTEHDVAGLDVSQVFERGPTRRALAFAGVLALLSMLLVALSPGSARIALMRLTRPLGDDVWPRFYHVEFRTPPSRLAAGQNFEVELLQDVGHRVPDDVRIHYRYKTGPQTYEEEVDGMKWVNGALVARKDNVQRPFWYRAEGGDDSSMGWLRLEVLEAPRLGPTQVTLYPPDYTGLPAEESEKSIHALRGTRIGLAGTVTKKVVRATLHHEDGSQLPLQVAEDGYSISLAADAAEPFVIDKTGQYWIELEDSEGLVGGAEDRWDIRAIPDLEPTVTIEKPGTNVYITPQGEVSLAVAVKDDLAIHNIELHFSRSDRTDVEDFAVSLYQGPERAPRQTETGLLLGGKLGESRVVEHRWLLSELKLEPGVQLTFWASATDYLPQSGKSTVRKITVITPDELEERLAQRQTLVLGELQRVLKLQQDARSQTRSLEIQVNDVGRIGKSDVDHAQSAELNQRQVTRTLTSPTEGIPAQIAEFLAELRSNHVDSPGVERNMTGILDKIERLNQQHLGTVESELTSFIKGSQAKLADESVRDSGTAEPDSQLKESLASAGQNQDRVVESLEQMLSELGRWDSYRRFARDVSQLQRDQEEIARQTNELSPRTLGRDFKDLPDQQQADLRKLASQQAELSRRLEKTQQQMAEMSRSLGETDPIAAATISDGLHQARQQAISDSMRKSGDQLEKNQLGQATGLQQKIARDLEDLQSILSNRREQELAAAGKATPRSRAGDGQTPPAAGRPAQEDEGRRENLRPRGAETRVGTTHSRTKATRNRNGAIGAQLQRLQAEQAGSSTSSAAGKMAGAGQQGEQGDAGGAQEQAAQAEKDLEEAAQQLAERRKQAEQDLAREQLARLEDSLKGLLDRQEKLIQETQRLQQLRASAGRLSRAQLATLGDLARQQSGLGGETSQLAEKLELTEVINLALSGAARHMDRAAELLELRDTGTQAQGAQEAARLRLAQLIAAFQNKNKPGDKEGAGGGNSGGGGSGGRSDGGFVLTQLKLLKLMQEDLNDRYRGLVSEGDENPRDVRRQLSEIAEEQGRLAELTLKLSEPEVDNPEDHPEKLPDVRQDGDASPDGLLKDLEALPNLDLGEPAEAVPDEVPPPDAATDPAVKEPS